VNFTSAQRMARLLHPFWAKERIVAVLKSYLDASGASDPNQAVVAVAGWGATEDEWDHWERRWLALLAELDLKKGWHHTDFLGKRDEYQDWSEAKILYAQGQLIQIFNEIGLLGIGAAVWRADYEEALASGRWRAMQASPYAFCLNDCAESLIHGFHEAPEDDGIAIYADQDGKALEEMGRVLFDWHTDFNRRNKNAINPAREVMTAYGPRAKYRPLEAADVLANETYRYMFNEKRAGMPKLGGIFVGQEDSASPIIRALHGDLEQRRAVLDVVLYNKRMLEERLDALESGEVLRRDPKAMPSRFIRAKI
jgi:hypothetical protein